MDAPENPVAPALTTPEAGTPEATPETDPAAAVGAFADEARSLLEQLDLDGWLLYDFRGSNPFFGRVLTLPGMLSRRAFLWLPRADDARPTLLLHSIEAGSLPPLPLAVRRYASRVSLEEQLAALLGALPGGRVAMEYSPRGDIPYISLVDAGTVELVRATGVEVVSSAELLQAFAAWSEPQLHWHLEACEGVARARDLAFEFIALQSQMGRPVRETEVQSVMVDHFAAHEMVFDHPPIVAFGPHAGDPHYAPQAGRDRVLQPGDAILVDVFARLDRPDAPYADITWMGCYGEPSAELREVFGVVREARDLAVRAIAESYAAGERPRGCDIDRAVRDFIASRGYGDAFFHRTGHSLGVRHTHGDAAHLDDFETRDTRRLIPGIGLTVEPGVYLESFGVRSEIDLVLDEEGPRVTTDMQEELVVVPLAGG